MDSDVALLQQYASYLPSVATAIDTISSNAQTLATALQNSPNFADQTNSTSIVSGVSAISTTAAGLYAAELGQIAGDLQSLIAGTVTVQSQGDASVLEDIASWFSNIEQNLGSLQSWLSELQADSTGTLAANWSAMQSAYRTIFQAGPSPAAAAADLNRIASRFTSLIAAHTTGTTPPVKAPPVVSTPVATSNTTLYIGAAAAIIAGGAWWMASKGYFGRKKSSARRAAR